LAEIGELIVTHPVDVDAAYGATERQGGDHGTDGLTDRVDTGVFDTPGSVDLPVNGP